MSTKISKHLFLAVFISVWVLTALPTRATAQIQRVELETVSPSCYTVTNWNIQLTGTWENPYLQEEIALDMDITAPSGKRLVLPCYYDSGKSGESSLWKARFMPQEAGKYSCTFVLREAGRERNRSGATSFTVTPSGRHGILHAGSDWIFRYDDGTPFRGIGENIAWESRTFDDSKFSNQLNENPKYNYGYMLPSLASHGGNFFRAWICRWNFPIDWKNDFNNRRYDSSSAYYNPSAVARLDWMIRLADSLGLHIMLTLGPGAYHIREGGLDTSAGEFFTDPASMRRYKNRLRYMIARWGYSPAIGAWELFNEVDNVMYRNPAHPIDHATIVRWHDTMSAYIKRTDPYGHLVTTSISHRDLPGLDTLHHIDFNQKHIYRNTRIIPSTIVAYEKKFSKPYVIGEFSYEWDWSKDFNSFKAGMVSDYKRGLWYGLFSPTPILPMSWWWEYFDSLGTDAYISHVSTISKMMLKAGNGSFDTLQVRCESSEIISYAVRCGKTIFLYAYNPSSKPVKTMISMAAIGRIQMTAIGVYDCDSGTYGRYAGQPGSKNTSLSLEITLGANKDKVYVVNLPGGGQDASFGVKKKSTPKATGRK